MLVLTVGRVHSALVASGFVGAFVLGCVFHYRKIVANADYGYPDEWLPSVLATIGDWAPERNWFQMCLALALGPRLVVVAANKRVTGSLVFWLGVARTLAAGGWVFITSNDSHGWHDNAMIVYLVLSLVYYVAVAAKTSRSHPCSRWFSRCLVAFVANIAPLGWCYWRHKVLRVAGAYSWYAVFEWLMVAIDVAFDFRIGELAGTSVSFVAPAEPKLA